MARKIFSSMQFFLSVNEAEIQSREVSQKNKLGKGILALRLEQGIKKQVAKQKKMSEQTQEGIWMLRCIQQSQKFSDIMLFYQAKMKVIMSFTNPIDQITEIKKVLNEHKEETKRMTTKVIKLEKELERANKAHLDALSIKINPAKTQLAPGQIQSGGSAQVQDEQFYLRKKYQQFLPSVILNITLGYVQVKQFFLKNLLLDTLKYNSLFHYQNIRLQYINEQEMQSIQKLLAGTILQNQQAQVPNGKKKGAEQIRVCSCGDPNPDFRGYCKKCFTTLNERFRHYLEKFREVSEEYDQYTNQDTKAADEKFSIN